MTVMHVLLLACFFWQHHRPSRVAMHYKRSTPTLLKRTKSIQNCVRTSRQARMVGSLQTFPVVSLRRPMVTAVLVLLIVFLESTEIFAFSCIGHPTRRRRSRRVVSEGPAFSPRIDGKDRRIQEDIRPSSSTTSTTRIQQSQQVGDDDMSMDKNNNKNDIDDNKVVQVGSKEYLQGFLLSPIEGKTTSERGSGLEQALKLGGSVALGLSLLFLGFMASNGLL